MANPRFNSQHSEVMLDVSAFHSSTPSTPQPKHHQETKVAQSPTIEASQSEARVPESAERVEDSYQDSLPMQPPSLPADKDEEDELYSLSPKGRQSLDAAAAKRKVQAQRRASMPKAQTIDALLDAGATIASSALNVATSDTKPTEQRNTSTHAHDRVNVNAEPDQDSADATITADQHAGANRRKLDATNPETYRPGRDESKRRENEASANVRKDKTESHGLPLSARNVTRKVFDDGERPSRTADAFKAKADNTTLKTSGRKSHGNSKANTGSTGLSATDTRAKEAAQSQDDRQATASTKDSRGRSQRQAKQTALGKLQAKRNKTESDVDDMTDDSQSDSFDIAVHSKQARKVTNRKQNAKHLPTPVTDGNLPKEKAETKFDGKLKSTKQHQTNVAASVTKQPNKTSTRGTAAASKRVGKTGSPATQLERVQLSTEARSSQSSPDHQGTDTIAVSRNRQHDSADAPPPKRPGALKRPGRQHSRGRRQRTDTTYEFPDTSSNTRKKRRSISRASKASNARAGPARQRMQSESVKERLDHTKDDLQLPPASRQTSPRAGGHKGRLQKPSVSRRKESGSRPPPETQARDVTTQHESHISQQVRSSHTANVKSHKVATGSEQTGTREKPGSSQVHAITIEQDSLSQSSDSPSPRKPANARSKTTVQAASHQHQPVRPQTPAMMPSSPPGSGRGSVYTHANDKPTIIAFNRQGPRNQGTSSARKDRGTAVPSKVFSDYRPSKASTLSDHGKTIGLATQLFPPSSQPSNRSFAEVTHTAQPSNVAKVDDGVFEGFTKNGKNKALAHMLRHPSNVADEIDKEDQDDSYAVIDDFEGTTLIDDHEQVEYSPKQPTASQVAMPPPDFVMKGKKESKTGDGRVQLPIKTVAKVVIATKDTPRPTPFKKSINVPKVKGATDSHHGDQASTLLEEGRIQRSAPRKKGAESLPTDNASAWKPSVEQKMVQPSQQTRKRRLAEPQAGSPQKKIRVSKENKFEAPEAQPEHALKASVSRSAQTRDPTTRLDRRKNRPSRRSTQASQGVDILGSPYPKELEVPRQTTALEVFSQQAGLSSDQTERSDAAPTGRLDGQAIPRIVPTPKVGLASSNGNPVPAAPRERTKAVTRIASGVLAEQLLAVRSVQTSEENPFTSSRERESSAGQGPAANKFKEALRQRGIDLSDRPPVVQSEELGDGLFDDVERTLVEGVDDSRNADQQIASYPGASEASSARSKVLEDVGDWRNSLKPHQSHLFDSLVIAAHKLVRHMVDHETADRTMIADYRRRGEMIVDELQRAHAKEYQQYTKNVQSWKTQAADELAAQGRKLKQRMRDAEKARAERKKALLARNGFDSVLEELVAKLD